jgi:hypothetical protein
MTICYLNDDFVELSKASISPLDRGFLFGDSSKKRNRTTSNEKKET